MSVVQVLACVLFVMMTALLPTTTAGTCWQNTERGSSCVRDVLQVGVDEAACCGQLQGGAWSPIPNDNRDISDIFFYRFIAEANQSCQPCPYTDPCDGVQCGENKRCKVRRGQPRCVCSPDCSRRNEQGDRHRGPICGSDQQTYRNNCAMLKDNCRYDRNVWLEYNGQCQRSCSTVDCQDNKHCIHDQNGIPHCVPCPTACHLPAGGAAGIPDRNKYCGTDGVTYPTMCHVKRASCLSGNNVAVAYTGACTATATCATVSCSGSQSCLVDPVTQQPQCHNCPTTTTGTTTGRPIVDASHQVCGTDGRSYDTWNDLKTRACQTGTVIRTAHHGLCGSAQHGPLNDGSLPDSSTATSGEEEEETQRVVRRYRLRRR